MLTFEYSNYKNIVHIPYYIYFIIINMINNEFYIEFNYLFNCFYYFKD